VFEWNNNPGGRITQVKVLSLSHFTCFWWAINTQDSCSPRCVRGPVMNMREKSSSVTGYPWFFVQSRILVRMFYSLKQSSTAWKSLKWIIHDVLSERRKHLTT
jgi:hypothetical protein